MSLLKSLFGKISARPATSAPAHVSSTLAAEEAKQRGNEHLSRGELDAAADCYREAVRLNPDFAEAYNNLGFVLKEQRRFAEAATLLDLALAIKPGLGPAHLNRGSVAAAQGQLDSAATAFRRCIDVMPQNGECHWRLGGVLLEQGHYEQAAACYEMALTIEPGLLDTYVNLGTVRYKLGQLDEAERLYRRALDLGPSSDAAYFLGITEQVRGRRDGAIAAYRLALSHDPAHARAHWNLSMLLLLNGDFVAGWAHYEKRLLATATDDKSDWMKDIKHYLPLLGEQRYWRGESLAGRRLLLWDEQGLGDTLMMMRYLPLLAGRASSILAHCDPRLMRVMALLPGVVEVIPKTQTVDAGRFDLHCSMMSLPYLMRSTSAAAIPATVPYVAVPETLSSHWAHRLGALGSRKKVGLLWGGNKDLARDALRSVPLAAFAPLMDIPGIDWISLQKGEPATQLRGLDWPVIDWMDECQDMLDTAALVANLELVISVDTSVAHLAGALGRPTWLLNRFESEWRWMLGREDSPWYPTLRIFSQTQVHDWTTVIARIRQELLKEAAR